MTFRECAEKWLDEAKFLVVELEKLLGNVKVLQDLRQPLLDFLGPECDTKKQETPELAAIRIIKDLRSKHAKLHVSLTYWKAKVKCK